MTANRNRTKGHDAERYYANLFRELGFKHCITTREGSRLLDECGIDLMNLPFLVQIKAGRQSALKSGDVLQYIEDRLKEKLPEDAPEKLLPKILIHKKDIGKGKKENAYHQLVTMTMEDFLILTKMKKDEIRDTTGS